jgi:hypothetical protein
MKRLGLRGLSCFVRIILQPVVTIAAVTGFISLAGGAESEMVLVVSESTLSEIMTTIVMPSADVLWNAVAIDVTANGTVVTAPETEEDWQQIRMSTAGLLAVTDKLLNENLPISNAGTVEPPPGEPGPEQIASLRKENWQALNCSCVCPARSSRIGIENDRRQRCRGFKRSRWSSI